MESTLCVQAKRNTNVTFYQITQYRLQRDSAKSGDSTLAKFAGLNLIHNLMNKLTKKKDCLPFFLFLLMVLGKVYLFNVHVGKFLV